LLALYIVFSFSFENIKVNNGRFTIPFPLFPYFDINGIYKTSAITSMVLVLLYIGAFLFSVSMILKSFKSKVLFSTNAIRNLNAFAVINLVAFPIFYLALRIFILRIPVLGGLHNLFLSFILGIFILFVAAIFKRGLKVQNENDLTI
ncbi:MAG: DUF2975 domain-containing protein, partial [Bacteroidota bacterium]